MLGRDHEVVPPAAARDRAISANPVAAATGGKAVGILRAVEAAEPGDDDRHRSSLPDDDEVGGFRLPLPPDDRLWRHPSEMAGVGSPLLSAAIRDDRPDHRGLPRSAFALALVAGLTGALLAVGVVAVTGLGQSVIEHRAVERQAVHPLLAGLSTLTAANQQAMDQLTGATLPAIARVDVDGGTVSGSGVLYRNDGYVLTSFGVVRSAGTIQVTLADGSSHRGSLVGSDPTTDIAVVRIDASGMPSAVLGAGATLKVGEAAVALGAPGLDGASSATATTIATATAPVATSGVVGAVGWSVRTTDGTRVDDLIRFDGPVPPAGAGGPLVDGSGAVVGITTALTDTNNPGVAYATPIEIARAVGDDLVHTGTVHRTWLGIQGTDLDGATASSHQVPGGVDVRDVRPASPADTAGIRSGDLIVRIDGMPVTSMAMLVIALRGHTAGDLVRLDLLRDDAPVTVHAVLGERQAG